MKYIKPIIHGILPSILLCCSVGSVYAFSFFSQDIANYINCSLSQIQFAFTMSIFFLGMGAAFFGPIVEKNVRKSALIATTLFTSGCLMTALGINLKNIWIVYLGYGLLNGLGQGVAYLSPVKTNLLWNIRHKGLASAISIIAFGLGSSLCVYISKMLMPMFGIQYIFAVLAGIYFVMMFIGSMLLKKPSIELDYENTIEKQNYVFKYSEIFKNRYFWQAWLFMFLNISCGLALIGVTKDIFTECNVGVNIAAILLMLCGLFNGGFRLVFAWWSDFLKNRLNIWLIISAISVLFMVSSAVYYPIIVVAILIINACYGGGFSTLPAILSSHYGNNALSRIHGLTLSAWGFAALPAFFINYFIFKHLDSFYISTVVLAVIYVLNFINVIFMKHCKI